MKRKVMLGAALWVLLITLAHIELNIGWGELGHEIAVMTGEEREELIVGFLPVT